MTRLSTILVVSLIALQSGCEFTPHGSNFVSRQPNPSATVRFDFGGSNADTLHASSNSILSFDIITPLNGALPKVTVQGSAAGEVLGSITGLTKRSSDWLYHCEVPAQGDPGAFAITITATSSTGSMSWAELQGQEPVVGVILKTLVIN